MRHIIFAVSGWAGTGKDEILGHLVRTYGTIHTGLADPGKRHGLDAYGFSYDQLWGPSKFRNAGDPRYPKPALMEFGFKPNGDGTFTSIIDGSNRDRLFTLGKGSLGTNKLQFMYMAMKYSETNQPQSITVTNTDPEWFLSPREFLQKYMELCNTLYGDTWINKGIEDHKLLATGEYSYSRTEGLVHTHKNGSPDRQVVTTGFSDFRHIHECRGVKSAASESVDHSLVPVLIRVKRPTVTKPPFQHRSETEQTRIRDEAFDFVIDNDGTLDSLYWKMDNIVSICSEPAWLGRAWSDEYVVPYLSDCYIP